MNPVRRALESVARQRDNHRRIGEDAAAVGVERAAAGRQGMSSKGGDLREQTCAGGEEMWPIFRLKDVALIQMGQSPPGYTYNDQGEGLPFFQGKADFGIKHPTVRIWCRNPNRIAESGDVLLSVRAPVGPTNVADRRCCIGRGLAAIRSLNMDVILPEFIQYAFKWEEPRFSQKGQGSTFLAVNRKDVESIKIPLPPLSEQCRIVEILNRADTLRQQRRVADEKAQRILPALFFEIFGDPATNPKEWETGHLGDVIIETQYGTSTRANVTGEGLPVLRMNNIDSEGHIDLTDLKYVALSDKENKKYALNKGDLLFNRTNSKELVGKTGLWHGERKAVAASYLIRVRIDREQAIPEFIWAYMNCPFIKHLLLNRCRHAIGMANINAQELRNLPLILPPKNLQEEFAEHLAELEHFCEQHSQSRNLLNQLFNTLLHRAFTGELTVRWHQAHKDQLEAELQGQMAVLYATKVDKPGSRRKAVEG